VRLLPHSLRWRLTLWYSLGLSATLLVAAAGSWYLLRRVMAERADRFLVQARDAFLVELDAEREMTPTLSPAIASSMRDIRFADIEFVVLDPALRVVARSDGGPHAPQSNGATLAAGRLTSALAPGAPGTARLLTLHGPDGGHRVAATVVALGGTPYTVAAVQSRRWLRETMLAVTAAYLTAIPAILLLAASGGYLLARRALEPVAEMGRRARAIEARSLHERLPVDEPRDELGQLASLINDLLGRIERAFAEQRRFVADASHELRTPVAVLRAEAEVALAQAARPEAEYRESLRIVEESGRRLSRVVDDLFLLARADGGPVPIGREPLYLDELVADTVRVLRALSAQRDVRIAIVSLPEAPVIGDPELLGRLLLNLLENAVKYSAVGSTVSVRLDVDDAAVSVSVADEGPGIPPEARARIFERFYRAEALPQDGDGATPRGAGLGLAIAKWVAEAHGGTLELVRSSSEGSEFRVTLPRAAAVAAVAAVATAATDPRATSS
jgi:two-component system OmpR family sensor kinase